MVPMNCGMGERVEELHLTRSQRNETRLPLKRNLQCHGFGHRMGPVVNI